jgi:phage gp36-like protein
MSWQTITAADIEPRLSDEELTALRRDYETTGKADPLSALITQVTAKVRRACAAGGATLGPASTIPDELLDSALSIIRYRLCSGMPGGLLNEDRRKEYADAITELDAIAKDAAGIVEPTTESTDTTVAGGITPGYSSDDPPNGPRNFDRQDQEGI